MGLNIGQIPSLVGGLERGRRVTLGDGRQGSRTEERPINPFQRDERIPIRVGFGEGTISGPGAAVLALNRSLDSARRVTPTVEELRAELRERFAKQREAQAEEERPLEFRNRVLLIPEPSAQARNFISQVNEAAGQAQARFGGENSETPRPGGPTITVNGETFPIRESGIGGADTFEPRFSVLA